MRTETPAIKTEAPAMRTEAPCIHTRRAGGDAAALVRAASAGDQRAWDALVRRYGPAIRAVARRHRLGKADQDDVAQRTWLLLFEHLQRVRNPGALGAWLTTVARRECLRTLATAQREIATEECEIVADQPAGRGCAEPSTPDELIEQSERRAALHAAVDALPRHERELMRTLLAKPAFTYDDLSAALGIPRGSIGPTRGRGMARLRRNPHLARAVGHAGVPVGR